MTARESILSAVQRGNLHAVCGDWNMLPRSYRNEAGLNTADILALFEERLLDYDATVTHCGVDDVPIVLRQILAGLGVKTVCVPRGFPLHATDGLVVTQDEDLSYAELDATEAVLTDSVLGIAETGSIVLQSGPGMGRRALTLIPDVHVCIVRASTVVGTVPEAFAALAPTAHLPTTFVSGPSATADIEMTRVKGVHGPRFLHVVLVADTAEAQAKGE